MRGEFGAGISAEWMASASPSSTSSVRRVKTERTRKMTRSVLMATKITKAFLIADTVAKSQMLAVERVERITASSEEMQFRRSGGLGVKGGEAGGCLKD